MSAVYTGAIRPATPRGCGTFHRMEDVIAAINRALRARGWSAQYASRQVGGSPEFIRNLRRGYVSSIEKFRLLCEVLELEFYVGPHRKVGAVDERRLEEAVDTVEQVLADSDFVLDPGDKASVVAAVYAFIGEERSPVTASRVKRLIAAMTGGRKGPGDAGGGRGRQDT